MLHKPKKVIPELCRDYVLFSGRKTYTHKDIILYALGVGLSRDPLDLQDLQYTYENSEHFAALPTYAAVIPPIERVFEGLLGCKGMPDFNPMMLLHADESLKFDDVVPIEATVECITKIEDVLDRGQGALVQLKAEISNVTQGKSMSKPFCIIKMGLFIRGIGGFSNKNDAHDINKNKHENDYNISNKKTHNNDKNIVSKFPTLVNENLRHLPADIDIILETQPNQAILYRLSGDMNPLHVDPELAKIGGFKKPILHGLCTFGAVITGLLRKIAKLNLLESVTCKFVSPVTPGDKLMIKAWLLGSQQLQYQVENCNTDKICLIGEIICKIIINLDRKQHRSAY